MSTHPTNEVIAEIRGEIARQGLTQKVLAERTGIKIQTLRRRLSGEAPLTVSELLTIAHSLDVEPAELLPANKADARRVNDGRPTQNPQTERNGQ